MIYLRSVSLFLVFISTLSVNLQAQTPTQAQIEQFQRLSPSEQRALASSLGVDVDSLLSQQQGGSVNSVSEDISGLRTTQQGEDNNGDELEEISDEGTDRLNLNEDQAEESTNERLNLFGHDIFNSGATTFVPATDIPIPDNYVLGPGDTIVLQLYGKDNNVYDLPITREGKILFPGIGPVQLAGLSFTAARARIEQIVSEQMIGVKSSVTLGTLRSIRVFVLGEARVPGSYVVHSLSTLTNAVFASGGITEIGSLRNIQLKRGGEVITTFDLYNLLLKGDARNDVRLLPGDVIFIPTLGKTVSVSGEVKRPAIYELKGEETLGEAIELAGGELPTAYLPATRIERLTDDGEKTLVNVDASISDGKKTPLKSADVIQVFSTLDTLRRCGTT